MKENNCRWHFRGFDTNRDEIRGANDPIITKFTEDFFNSLVRESVQNSMDAIAPGKKVVDVRYNLSKVNRSDYPQLFGIKAHIDACLNTHKENNRARELYGPMSKFMECDELDLLTISDYNTNGMPYIPDNIYKNPFQAFVNSEGLSVKPNSGDSPVSKGGSFGIGKGAYFLMSPVRALMVSTMVNDDDHHTYFEGVSRLCTHDIDGKPIYHMGFYSEDGSTPVIGGNIPDDFRREEVGTSISLVGKYSDLGTNSNIEDEIEKAVLANFWLAIYEEKLVVTVGGRKPINKQNLESKIIQSFDGGDFKMNNPYLFYKAYSTAEDRITYFKFKLENHPLLGHCELHLRIGETGKKDRVTCMRDMMMLIQTVSSPKQHHAGLCAVFLCLGEPGNGNLELLENESHDHWAADGKRGAARTKANEILKAINTFITDKVDSILGSSNEKIDVTIDSLAPTDSEMEQIEAKDGDSGNPFGVVQDKEKNLKEGFDRFSVPNSIGEKPFDEILETGQVIAGPSETGDEGGEEIVPFGRGSIKKIKKKGGKHPKPGKGKKVVKATSPDGSKEYRFIPAYFDVAAHLESGQWVHTLFIEIEDDDKTDDRVFIDISVGAEGGGDIKINIKSAYSGRKKLPTSQSRIMFDGIKDGTLTLDVVFEDNMRHTINLG